MERRHITLQRQVLVWFIALTRYLRDNTYKMETYSLTKHDIVKIFVFLERFFGRRIIVRRLLIFHRFGNTFDRGNRFKTPPVDNNGR